PPEPCHGHPPPRGPPRRLADAIQPPGSGRPGVRPAGTWLPARSAGVAGTERWTATGPTPRAGAYARLHWPRASTLARGQPGAGRAQTPAGSAEVEVAMSAHRPRSFCPRALISLWAMGFVAAVVGLIGVESAPTAEPAATGAYAATVSTLMPESEGSTAAG